MLDARLIRPALDAALEWLLNSAIRYDRHGATCFKPLAGKVVAVRFEDLNLAFRLIIGEDRITLDGVDGEADARIVTRSILWPLLKRADSRDRLLAEGRARLEGNTELAVHLLDCLGQLEPDGGELIEHWLGTLPASLFTQAERQAHRLLRRLAHSTRQNIEEYLQFEAALLPTRAEYEVFAQQVTETAAEVAALEARIARLEREANHG